MYRKPQNGFYKTFFMLMIPMALRSLIASLVNFADSVMIGSMGTEVIAAVGIANQITTIFYMFVFGACSGAGVLSSQYRGNNDIKSFRNVLGLNLILVTVLSAIFIFISAVIPKTLMSVYSSDTAVISYGIKYLRIACFAGLLYAVTSAYSTSLASSENADIPFYAAIIGFLLNLILNYILIFGKFGFPKLGVEGAAIATVIARIVEFLVIFLYVYAKKLLQAASIKQLFIVPKQMIKIYLKTSLPVFVNEGLWGIGSAVYGWIFAQVGTEAVAIRSIVGSVEGLMVIFFHSCGQAAGVLTGKQIGSGDSDGAFRISKRLMGVNALFSLGVMVVFLFFRKPLLSFYDVPSDVYNLTLTTLLITAIFINIKASSFYLIIGAFRSGGAITTSALIDLGSMWLVGIPLVFTAGIILKLPFIWIYSIMISEEVVKLGVSLPYYFSKKWIRNLVKK